MQPRQPAIRQGLIFGAILAVLLAINAALNVYTGIGWGSYITTIAGIAAFIVAGMRAGQATGKVSSGLVAGLVAGIFSSFINTVVVAALVIVNADRLTVAANQLIDKVAPGSRVHYTTSSYIVVNVGVTAAFIIIAALVGMGLGALGGRIGKDRAVLPQENYHESLYQGLTPQQQPPQPGV